MARFTYIPNRVIDTDGISDGANIYFYQTGTTTPITVYSDAALTTPVSNPYAVATGAAVPALYYAESSIRVRVVDNSGAVVSDDDPYRRPIDQVELSASTGSSLVGHIATGAGATARTVQSKLRDVVTVEDFGAVGDNSTDDTAAIQAMIDAVGYFRLQAKTYKITDSLTVPAAASLIALGSVWNGEGMERSVINCVGLVGKPAIKPVSATSLYRITMRDFKVSGDCDTCIDFTLSGGNLLFQSEFRNLVLSSAADSAFKANDHFSCAWYNVHVSSTGGHGFDIEGGNSTALVNCYAHDIATGFAGYRIKGTAALIACNGLDSGDIWGMFGAATALDGSNVIYNIRLINCNIEDFGVKAIEVRYFGSLALEGVSFVAKATGTYTTLVEQNTTGSSTTWRFYDSGSTFTTKGATMSGASRLLMNANGDILESDGKVFTDLRRVDQSLTYPIPIRNMSNAAFQIYADNFNYINWTRAYGFVLQVPALWTVNATTFAVTRINTVRTANTSATTFQYASGGEKGQRLTIIVEDANTTIAHNAAFGGRFLNASGANIVAASGDVYEYVHNGTNWKQIA